jgi:hypothetical protein
MIELVAFAVLCGTPAKQGVDGGLPLAWVEEVIESRAAELGSCFPTKGKRTSIHYSFGVSPAGRVEGLAVAEVKGEWERVTCVGTVVESLSFPSMDAGTSVSWVFTASTPKDAGVVEERVLDVAEVQDKWTDDVTRCLAHSVGLMPGRVSVSLDMSALGFAFSSEVTSRVEDEGFARCVRAATRSWRIAPGKRERVVAGWIVAPSEREAKKYFDPKFPAVELVLESVRIKGPSGLPESVISAEVARSASRVKACHEIRLASAPRLAGLISVAFVIGPEGNVVQSEVAEDTTGHPTLASCVVDVVKAMKFPKPEGGGNVNVTFPWFFHVAGNE